MFTSPSSGVKKIRISLYLKLKEEKFVHKTFYGSLHKM